MAPKALSICFAVVRWAPVIFITAVVVWSYYAYVLQMCIFTVDSVAEKVIYLIIYHPVLAMFVWAYWKTTMSQPGFVPLEFYLPAAELERFEREESDDNQRQILEQFGRNLPVQCRTGSGAMRYCEKCKCVKPDRAHHCSVCGRCVLKMDHHCPWVNNCICFTNYKFFVLFLGYALLYCLYVAATSLQYFIKFWTEGTGGGMGKFHILFLFFASVMFAVSVISLFGYHMYLVGRNQSTLESFRAPVFRSGPDKDGFSLGRLGNFIEIFGDDKKYWFLPIFSSCGDGVVYPTRVAQSPVSSYNTMENTENSSATTPQAQPSFGDGVNYPIRTVDEDYDSLLGQRQRWMEEGDDTGIDNSLATEKM